ncbi:MAG: hypothetical protein FWE24_08120 [Defluviitaleaceae bacterium]|nr:hypothetical protein [Defluviitaleaceae bacterium]
MPTDNINEIEECTDNLFDHTFEQSINELIYSIALEEKAIAHLICAEAEKVKAALKIPNITIKELLCINNSVESTLESITRLESFLLAKLKATLIDKTDC